MLWPFLCFCTTQAVGACEGVLLTLFASYCPAQVPSFRLDTQVLSCMLFPIFRHLASSRSCSIIGHILRVSRHKVFASIFGTPSPSLGFFIVSTPETKDIFSLDPHFSLNFACTLCMRPSRFFQVVPISPPLCPAYHISPRHRNSFVQFLLGHRNSFDCFLLS